MNQEINMQAMHEQFNHAYAAIGDSVRSMTVANVDPAAMASALGAAYVRYMSALMVAGGRSKGEVLVAAKEGIDSMQEFVDEVFELAKSRLDEDAA